MNRRDAALALPALSMIPTQAWAQTARKPARIAYLGTGSVDTAGFLVDALKLGMKELGYVEGKNVEFEVRWAMGSPERLPDLAKELVALRPDAMIAPGANQVRAMQRATASIPIIMANVSDPVAAGFAKSLAFPGGNITGLTTMAVDYLPKLLELLLTVAPTISRAAILLGRDTVRAQLTSLEATARAKGVNTLVIEMQTLAEIENAFARITNDRVKAAIALPSGPFFSQRTQIADMALKSRVLTIFTTREFCDAGGLMSYGSNFADQIRSTAAYVDKILKGAKPGDLPIEQPRTLDLTINLKTAEALGVTLPQSLLLRASSVIQ
jgi:putative ABC transport system substrate-binding protein